MNIKEQIQSCTDEMLANLNRLVRYDSKMMEALPGKPFGEEAANVLAEMLDIAQEMRFRTKNVDNYFGYAEMGEGEEIIGIAGHLDIVPAGEGWIKDPFAVTREGDVIYGRGVTDDKGPVMQALYAMKLLRDNQVPLNKRVRLIFGCNEENGSGCMKHYMEVEEPITYGFTPDATFPCICGEKGHMAMLATSKNTKIISMNGGFVSNAVCDKCTTVIPAEISTQALENALKATDLHSYEITEADGQITIYAQGLAAHASTPLLGVNAAGCTMQALEMAGFEDDFVTFYNSHIGTKCDGAGVGLKLEDEYGDLTMNHGIVKTENGMISCTLDLRTPVTYEEEGIRAACEGKLEDENGSIEILSIGPSLFFPKDSDLVKALVGAYSEVTGDEEAEPLVIGGGTYAKALTGIIAFGPEKEGRDYRIHNTDEFAIIPEMEEAIEIYYKAIMNLLAI